MLTIYYSSSYWDRKRIWLTKSLKFSKLYYLVQYFYYRRNIPMPNNMVNNGPQKVVNNYLKIFRKDKNVSFNDFKYNNSYIIQFDEFGETVLNKVISKNLNSNILIGPLFDIKGLQKLITYKSKIPNLKIVVASDSVKNNFITKYEEIGVEDILVLPVGIFNYKNRSKTSKAKSFDCLIYFKKRTKEELEIIKNLLKDKKINYKIFNYGSYKNEDLTKAASTSTFGIILDKTESQGIAIQEILGLNLPLLVCDYKENKFDGENFQGTSVPYWSDECGVKINDLKDLETALDELIENIDSFSPENFIKQNLSFDICKNNLIEYMNTN